MSEPIYLPRTAYQSMAEVLSPEDVHAGIDALMQAHRTIAAGFIKDHQLTPRQLEYVRAVRNWIAKGHMFDEDPVNPEPFRPMVHPGADDDTLYFVDAPTAASIAAELSIPDDPPSPVIENPDFVSAAEEALPAPKSAPVEKQSVFKSVLRRRKKS